MKEKSATLERVLSYWFRSFPKPVNHFFVVGGVVRDRLMGLPAGDVDLVCDNALPVAEEAAARKGAALVAFTKKEDSPCFRVIEREHPGFSIDISPLKEGDILLDLAARDFTVNAMALEVTEGLKPGRLVDPFDGSGDLEQRVLRMTTPEAFRNDPLRIFRAFRLAASLGFAIDSGTLAEARRCSGLLEATAGERILAELEMFLREQHVSALAQEMIATGAIDALFPETIRSKKEAAPRVETGRGVLSRVEDLLENPEEFLGAFTGTATKILDREPRRFLVKAGALLLDSLGVFTTETADAVADRLRMPRKTGDALALLASGYGFLLKEGNSQGPGGEEIVRYRRVGDEIIGASILATAFAEARGFSNSYRERIKEAVTRYLSGLREAFSRPPLISGKDLVSLGIPPGPAIGEVLRHARNAQDLGDVSTREDALRAALEVLRTLEDPPP
jgi:tRNA nucleotidyltransferase/poly(A) polymerase